MQAISTLVNAWYYEDAKMYILNYRIEELQRRDLTVEPAASYTANDLDILIANNNAITETTAELKAQEEVVNNIKKEILATFIALGVTKDVPVLCKIDLGRGYDQNVRVSYNGLNELAFDF